MSSIPTVEIETEPAPACGVAKQCRGNTFRRVTPRQVIGFFEPCRNEECFGAREPEDGEQVVVSRGGGSSKMHAPRGRQ